MGKECALVYCSTICYAGKNRYNWIRGTAPHFSCKYGHWSIKRDFICSHRVCNDEKEIISWRWHGRNFTRSYFYSPRLLNSTCWQKHATREAFRVRGKDVVILAGFEPWTQNHCIRRGRSIHSANPTWTARHWYCNHFSIYLFEGIFLPIPKILESKYQVAQIVLPWPLLASKHPTSISSSLILPTAGISWIAKAAAAARLCVLYLENPFIRKRLPWQRNILLKMAFLRHCKNTDKQQSILGSSLLKPWIKLRFNTAIFNFIVRMASRFRKANVLSVRAEENFLKVDVNGADS